MAMDPARPAPTDPLADALSDDLVDRARRGDGAARRRIHDALGPRLVGYARGQGVEDPDVVANETLLRVLTGLDDFRGDAAKLRSWAFVIAHNLVVDDHRRRARRPRPVDGDVLRAIEGPVDVEVAVVARSEVDRTLAAIHELVPDQRAVLLLRHVADLSLADTATVLGRRTNAVKQLEHRARRALAERLSDAAVTRDGPPTFTGVR